MIALHGFLGQPTDWDGLLGEEWQRPNWLDGLKPQDDLLDAVAQHLNQLEGEVLLGYSMGGRIALHMLVQNPQKWRKAIIVSASPGLRPDEDREKRLQSDRVWAHRFLTDDWHETVEAWNAQAVFAHDSPDRLPRLESDYNRASLAAALVDGSVARQRDLREELAALPIPIVFLAGEKDPKYEAIAEECAALNPLFQAEILPDAGHRVPWGNPEAFTTAVNRFLSN